ncbi:hypothetical protein EDC01DRAFT_245819 [Geopyxis carbonaria]|nr:hypothetical protein EDC01DRAFT_245819 [Geopyxis carbonaria]
MDVLSVTAMLTWLVLLITVTYYVKMDMDSPIKLGDSSTDWIRGLEHPFFSNPTVLKMFVSTPIMYVLCLWLIKGAFLAMYFDVLPWNSMDNKKLKAAMYGATAYCILTFIAEELAHLLKCRPISESWAPQSKICTKPYLSQDLIIITYATDVTTDLFILLMPLMIIRTLRMRRAHWTAMGFLFFVASMSIAGATLRFIFLLLAAQINSADESKGIGSRIHATYNYTLAVITWTSVEIWATCFAFALPPLRVYLRPLARPLMARDCYTVEDGQLSSTYYAKATGGGLKMDRNSMLNSETELRTILVEQSLEQTIEHVDRTYNSHRSQDMRETKQGL